MKKFDMAGFALALAFVSAVLVSCGGKVLTKDPSAQNITVLPVEGLADDFVMGVDVSSLISVEKSGAVFYDARGKKADPIKLLKAGGANAVRIRVWNDPFDADGKTYGGGYCDIDNAVKIGKRATAEGMKVLIDFHYSDFWADPNKQTAPKAWADFSIQQKEEALAAFTTDCLRKLKDGGVKVSMVQVGNEINNGMSGETLDPNVCALLKAGCKAVREADPAIKVILHYTDPLSEGYLEYRASILEKHGVDYDVFGISYYPFWHGDVKKLSVTLRKLSNIYNKKVMVLETSYPFTDEDGDGFGNVVSHMSANQEFKYPFNVEGQAIAVRDVIEAVAKVKNAGLGVFYWEPAWIPPKHYDAKAADAQEVLGYNQKAWEDFGSGWAAWAARGYDKEVKSRINGGTWDNQAFFDYDGKVMDSINVFNYARTGSKGPLNVLRVEDPSVEFAYGMQGKLPETVRTWYNDGSVRDEAVEWDAGMAAKVTGKPDFGEYKIKGKVKGEYDTVCVVKVSASNYLANGDFEKGDLSGWTVTNDSGRGNPHVDKNSQNAKEGLAYATGWDLEGFDFTLEQTVEVSEGRYKCFAYFEGTGIHNPTKTALKVRLNRKDGSSREYEVPVVIPNEWKKFFKADVPGGIEVDGNTQSVTVSVRMECSFSENSGANGAWMVCDDVNLLLAE